LFAAGDGEHAEGGVVDEAAASVPAWLPSSSSCPSGSVAARASFFFSISASARFSSSSVDASDAGAAGSTTCTWHHTRWPNLRRPCGPTSRQYPR